MISAVLPSILPDFEAGSPITEVAIQTSSLSSTPLDPYFQ